MRASALCGFCGCALVCTTKAAFPPRPAPFVRKYSWRSLPVALQPPSKLPAWCSWRPSCFRLRASPETMPVAPLATVGAVSSAAAPATGSAFVPGDYPEARRDDAVKEEHFGRVVHDPYRYLEDPDAEETKIFVNEQNKRTFRYFESHPLRENVKKRLTKLNDYPKYGCPFKRGSYFYQFRNSGLQPQSVLWQFKSLEDEPTSFLDPNTLEADGTAALSTYGFSDDGKLFAYGISHSGSDWISVHVKETAPGGETYDDIIEWCKFTGLSWTHDNKGFFYNRYPKPTVDREKAGTETGSSENALVYYHRLGTKQSDDILIFKDPEHPDYMFGSEVSDDGDHLILSIHPSCDPVNKLYVAKLEHKSVKSNGVEFDRVVDNFDAAYDYVTNEGSSFVFRTNASAPRYKLARIDLAKPNRTFLDLIPETKDVLDGVNCVAGKNLVVMYNRDVKHILNVYDLESGRLLRSLPVDIGTINGLTGRKEDDECFYSTVSFLNPGIVKRHSFKTNETTVFQETKICDYDQSIFKVSQEFYTSKDGTKIPIFIVSRADLQRNGKNPTLLYGYGGFNVSIMPSFSYMFICFVQHLHGVVAVANIRGGGEYGEEWHKAGNLRRKQNAFDDFQYAAKYLARERYTCPQKLAIQGGSNGGLLVAACINQDPQLFGAACADVGVMDMLRFHKFTIGHAWRSDYGDPGKKEDFEYIMTYSPLHNVRDDQVYPAVLLTTGDHDDRVVPLHTLKFIAELQHKAKSNPNPLFVRVETKAGHGAGKPTQKRIDEATDKICFFSLALKADWHD